VTVDVTPLLDGFCADGALTVPVGRPRPAARRAPARRRPLPGRGRGRRVAGARRSAIGAATERTARAHGATVYRELQGHGIGRTMHEPPGVPNVHVPRLRRELRDGLVLAVEPMLGLGGPELVVRDDGWTIATADGRWPPTWSTRSSWPPGRPLVLTA
jgi:methionyl aminopeptidase